jgi:methylenetetrahydrofolate--tRNA-(uracil-5-)-methyltransferase
MGGLYRYLRDADPGDFQPMNSNFGLLDPLQERIRNKREKRQKMSERARRDQGAWIEESGIETVSVPAGAAV